MKLEVICNNFIENCSELKIRTDSSELPKFVHIYATPIKISDKSKERLEKLRARLLLQDRKLKQDELIDFIISLAETNPIILNQNQYKGLSNKEQEKFFAFTFKTGKSSKSIDEELYAE